jgi:hypothetical protein
VDNRHVLDTNFLAPGTACEDGQMK